MADKPKDEIISRGKTADDKIIQLWSDGSITGALGSVIKGSPHARTEEARREALAAGWLVMGEVSLYDFREVPALIATARKVARRMGLPGDVRAELAAPSTVKPIWTVQEADRDGKPLVRIWRLPRATHPGLAVWDEVRGSHGRGRYQVMAETRAGGLGQRSGGGTYAPTGVAFHDLASLTKYLRETSALTR